VHECCSRYIENESCPEKDNMPWLKIPGDPFGPDPGRIEKEGEGDQYGGYNEQFGIISENKKKAMPAMRHDFIIYY